MTNSQLHEGSIDNGVNCNDRDCWCWKTPEHPSSKDLFYLQTRGHTGNSLLWWREGRHGYTNDIKKAHVFTREEAFAQQRVRPTEDFPWRKDYIDARVQSHIVIDDVDRHEEKGFVAAPETDWQRIARERTADLGKADAEIERLKRRVAALEQGAAPKDADAIEGAVQALQHAKRTAPEPGTTQHSADHLTRFSEWLVKEMPAGTVIGDPVWWARKLLAAACVFADEAPAPPPCNDAPSPEYFRLLNAALYFVPRERQIHGEIVALLAGSGPTKEVRCTCPSTLDPHGCNNRQCPRVAALGEGSKP